MRYRRFGRSDLEVSEVGFGVWTLASDWWGVVEDKQGSVVLVSAGDLLGAEGFKVTKVTRGCLSVSGPEAEIVLCADRPEVPQT